MSNRNVPFDTRGPKYAGPTVSAFDLRDTLNRFRLVGPLTPTILRHSLQPAQFVGYGQGSDHWWQSHFNEKPEQNQLGLNSSPKPRSVRYIVARDPRYVLPPKRGCVEQEVTWPADEEKPTNFVDAIWNSDVRDAVTAGKVADAVVNKRRSAALVPGTPEAEDSNESKVPVMLIHQDNDFGSGWDVVVPAGWAMPFWMNLVFRGARVGGLQQLAQLSLEQQR